MEKDVSKNHWDAALGVVFVEHLAIFESPPMPSVVLENNKPSNMEVSKNYRAWSSNAKKMNLHVINGEIL